MLGSTSHLPLAAHSAHLDTYTMRLSVRRLQPGAVFSSFFGILDIKLGEYRLAPPWRRVWFANLAGCEIILLFGVSIYITQPI